MVVSPTRRLARVFVMRQYAGQAVSDELIETARVDGCGTARIRWNVVVPALRPAAAVLGLLTLMTTWNDFLRPYAVPNDPENPTVLVFVLFGRQIIGGIMEGAVKA